MRSQRLGGSFDSSFILRRAVRSTSVASPYRQVHLLEERLPARVVVKLAKERVVLEPGKTRVALHVRALQPFKGRVAIPAPSVDLGELVGRVSCALCDQHLECRFRLPDVAEVLLGKRDEEERDQLVMRLLGQGKRIIRVT